VAQAWRNEAVSIEIEGDLLTPLQKNIFFTGLIVGERPAFPEPATPPVDRPGVWITFGLPEGRTVRILYDPSAQEFIDAFGSEVYKVPEQTALAVAAANSPGRGPEVEQQSGRGSPLWWVVMLGGGCFGLALAAWIRRRDPARA
jgi:hypothetical protein